VKKIYAHLQFAWFPLCILFSISAAVLPHLQKANADWAVWFSWFLSALSIFVFTCSLYWIKNSWQLPKTAAMIALFFSSTLGLLIGISALIGMYGFGMTFYKEWTGWPRLILIGLTVMMAAFELIMSKKNSES
jgi:hypothetical protein